MSYGYDLGANSDLARWERLATPEAAPPVTAVDLAHRVILGSVERPSLMAPVPTELSLRADVLVGTGLDVVLSVVDLGLALEDGRLRRAEGLSDGLVFAVQVVDDEGAHEVWAREVEPGTDFLEDSVDLSAFQGRRVQLRLVTRAGPSGEAQFDYALWSDLRITGTPERPPERPHVVLIDVDTLRADRLGCYGYSRPTAPRLDAWAASQAVVYGDCMAANNWTLPSTVSMLTGLTVTQHQVLAYPRRITEAMAPLAQRLSRAGHETRARTDGGFVGPVHGFSVGFDLFDARARAAGEYLRVGWQPELQAIAARRSERPLFVFLQSYQVHAPFLVDDLFADGTDPDYGGALGQQVVTRRQVLDLEARRGSPLTDTERHYVNDLYDAGVRRMDGVVGDFLDGLDDAFGGEQYLVIFTSDHGEELFERDRMGHGQTLYREQLAVPLLVRYPGAPSPGSWPSPATAPRWMKRWSRICARWATSKTADAQA